MMRTADALLPFLSLLFLTAATCAPEGAGGSGTGTVESLSEEWARAVELHTTGLAALENEQPAEAEAAYRELTTLVPEDPMPWANLAVALLRQQETEGALEAIDTGLETLEEPPEGIGAEEAGRLRGELLAIRGAILDWDGRSEEALQSYRMAAEAGPRQPEILYTLYRQAVSLGEEEAAGRALERLVEIRPQNFVVQVERGKRAIQEGDRAAATEAFLRLRELLWQAPPVAETALGMVLRSLEAEGDVAQNARVPAARLENVLKVTPMYRESLRELSTGIQAVPVRGFAAGPPRMEFGDPIEVTFGAERLAETATLGRALAVRDLDGDRVPDVARVVAQNPATLELRLSTAGGAGVGDAELAAPGATGLLAADLFNDGGADLLAYGPGVATLWNGAPAPRPDASAPAAEPEAGDGEGGAAGDRWPGLQRMDAAASGLGPAGGAAAVAVDFDIEGDLDLVLAGAPAASGPANVPAASGDTGGTAAATPAKLQLYRNALPLSPGGAPLEAVGEKVFPALGDLDPAGARDLVATDLDRDGDTDLVLAGTFGVRWLDNLRQGRFADRTASAGLDAATAAEAVASADLDNDGDLDLLTAGDDVAVWRNLDGRFERQEPAGLPSGSGGWSDLAVLDLDNDGRLDLALAGAEGVAAFGQLADGGFRALPVEGGPASAAAVAGADLDGDGDLDLLAAGDQGLHRLTNRGGDRNNWLSVSLVGLSQGNSKNARAGTGATVEVRSGSGYQLREHDGGVSHFGLGRREQADAVRVVWANGVPQNRVAVAADQTIVEEQVLKGSCPFLYTYTGEGAADGSPRMAFVTDLLWKSPAGLPVAPGVYAPADPDELVAVVGARPVPDRMGRRLYDLRITEELWEAAYFDLVRLWVVDHPADAEAASNLKVVPRVPAPPDRILASRELRPVAGAIDGLGRDVTERVRRRDDVYADGYRRSAYQGLAAEPWTFTLDLGPAAAAGSGPVRLHLDGWFFPTDASINIALGQGDGLRQQPPRLEVETPEGWRVLVPEMGHPAGKTKTMVVDTPPLPKGAHRLRIVTNQWISWDRVAWTRRPADDAVRVVARLAPKRAELRYRGFSKLVRKAPNAPHEFDYSRTSTVSPWEPVAGPYTAYGDVRELVVTADDRSVILAPGDEMALLFDASELPPPEPGFERTLFLESHGWDKDYDRNTWAVERGTLPLPFHGMGVYPWPEGVEPPDLGGYREEWLTREWPGPDGG